MNIYAVYQISTSCKIDAGQDWMIHPLVFNCCSINLGVYPSPLPIPGLNSLIIPLEPPGVYLWGRWGRLAVWYTSPQCTWLCSWCHWSEHGGLAAWCAGRSIRRDEWTAWRWRRSACTLVSWSTAMKRHRGSRTTRSHRARSDGHRKPQRSYN